MKLLQFKKNTDYNWGDVLMTLKSWDALPLQLKRNVRKLYGHLQDNTSDTLSDWEDLPPLTKRSKIKLWTELASKIDLPSWKELTYREKISRKLRWGIIYNELSVTQRTISFSVDDGDDTPIQGAKVKMGRKSSTTGNAGGCTITSIPDGDHTVEVTAEGYEDYTEAITTDESHTSFTISLTAITEEENENDES
jgi:hypothetical protein